MLRFGVIFVFSSFVFSGCESVKFVGLLQNLLDQNLIEAHINEQCKTDLFVVKNALENNDFWALRLLDSSGYIGPDFIWGNNIFVGSPKSCNWINTMEEYLKMKVVNSQPPFSVGYRVSHIRHWSKSQFETHNLQEKVLSFGFCVPSSCEVKDVHHLVETLIKNPKFYNTTIIGSKTQLINTKELMLKKDFFQSTALRLFLSCLFLVSGLTCLQSFVEYRKRKKIGYIKKGEMASEKEVIVQTSQCKKMLQCFSLSKNIEMATRMELDPNSIKPIHGIKAITASLFILGHIIVFGISSFNNMYHFIAYKSVIWLQPLMTVHLSVDTFFVISGVIVSYMFSQYFMLKKKESPVLVFFKAVLGRYIRLTPTYVVSMMLAIVLAKFLNSLSPFYQADDNEEKCSREWIMNLLYINNFSEWNNLCMLWSWYLSADFQCYFITIILLLIYKHNRALGRVVFLTTFFLFIGINAYLGYTKASGITLDAIFTKPNYLYTPFWSRFNAFLVGVYAGKYLNDSKKTLNLRKSYIATGWSASIISLIFLTYIHAFEVISPTKLLIYMAFARILWGASIAWIIVACATGHGGIANKFLSAKMFIPLSRLSYCVYLINPICVAFVSMTNGSAIYLDFPILAISTVGFVVTVFVIAFIFMLFFETPFLRLTKLLL